MEPEEQWKRLADQLVARRTSLGYRHRNAFASATGFPNDRVIADLENARRSNYSPATIAQVERAYQWERGSISSILDGREPIALGDEKYAEATALAERAIKRAQEPFGEGLERRRRALAASADTPEKARALAEQMFRIHDGIAVALDTVTEAIAVGTPRSDVGRMIKGITAVYFGSGAFQVVHSGDASAAQGLADRIAEARTANGNRPGGPGFMEAMANAVGNAVYRELGGDEDIFPEDGTGFDLAASNHGVDRELPNQDEPA